MNQTDLCASSQTRWADAGWLILRLGIGATFLFVHGGPKLLAGTEKWAWLGGAMGHLGITFAPAFWGFLAALSEGLGGLLLMLGLFVRPAAAFMLVTMLVAALHHHAQGDSFVYPLELAVVFLALLIGGSGRYALGRCLCRAKEGGMGAPETGGGQGGDA